VIEHSRVLMVVGALALGAAGCGEDEADRFSGEQRKIVEVIEEFRVGMDQADGPRVCRTFTAAWAQAIGEGAGGCEQWVRKEMEGARQAPIDVKEVRLRGGRRAVANVVEKDEPLRVDFEKVGAAWKISRFSERSGSG
jgi:hypothetical protein